MFENQQYQDDSSFEGLTAVAESIDYAFDVIATLQGTILATEAACHNPSIGSQRQCLALATLTRRSITAQYAIEGELDSCFAIESVSPSTSLVFALEEEIGKAENIIVRMIDAVVNAFKWLIEKIVGVFGKGDTRTEAAKKSDKLDDTFAKVLKDMPTLPNGGKVTSTKVSACFGFMGNEVDLAGVETLLKQQSEHSKNLTELLLLLSPLIGRSKTMSSSLKSDSGATEITAGLTKFKDEIGNLLRNHLKTAYNANEHAKYGILKGEATAGEGSYLLSPIITPRGPGGVGIIYNSEVKGNPASFTSKFAIAKTEKKENFQLSLPEATKDLETFIELNRKVRLEIAANNEELKGKVSSMKSDTEGMISVLSELKNNTPKSDNKELMAAVNAFSAYAKGLGSMFVAVSSGQTAAAAVPDLYASILQDVLSRSMTDHSKEVKDNAKKVKEGDESKEEPAT